MIRIRTRLFHAIVGLGLVGLPAACGGATSTSSSGGDAGNGPADGTQIDSGDNRYDAGRDRGFDTGSPDDAPVADAETPDATWDAVPIK